MVNIAVISFCYDTVEDRIRLIGNMSNGQPRVDFWLTRNLVLRLLTASADFIKSTSDKIDQVPLEHRSALTQFEHDEAQQISDIQHEKSVDHSGFACVLLKRMDISVKDKRYRLAFFVDKAQDPVAVSVLTETEMHRVLHLIHAGAKHLDWGGAEYLFQQEQVAMRLQ